MSGIWLPSSALTISLFLIIIFFTKTNIENKETKIYKEINIINFIFSLNAFVVYLFAKLFNDYMLVNFMQKIHLILLILVAHLFVKYIAVINDFNPKIEKILSYIVRIVTCISSSLTLILPMDTINYGDILDLDGCAYYVAITTVVIYYIMMVVLNLIYFIKKRKLFVKNIPYIILIALFVLGFVLRIYYPEAITETYIVAFVLLIMYFTIENPDIKMLNEVNTAKISAEKANAAKTEFLSSMSHEIRTPLNAIVGFSEAITEEDDIEKAKTDARDIILAANNLLEIVNGILDISKIEANKMEIIEKEYNPTELFENLAKLVAPRIGDKPIDLNVNIASDLPISLYGDSGKIKQIVTNILTNAVKYTDEGHINYTVSCVNLRNETSLVISVEDSGRGIKPEDIDKLFNKFQRVDEDRNTTIEGTGLGLAITKKLVEMMGGKIVVQSVYGSGSKFTIYLKQKIDINIDDLKNIKRKQIQLQTDFTGKKILVVDDNELNLKVDLRVLAPYNVEVTTAKSGYECIDLVFNKNEYDLILMDDMMPGMSGSETFEKLKKDSRFKTPVVILTANAIEGMKAKYLDIGFDDYLSKPIEKPELGRVLNKFLNDSVTQTQSIIEFVEDEEKKEEQTEVPAEDPAEVKENVEEEVQQEEINNFNTKEYLESNNIDVDHGLELLGDMDMYNSIMGDFINEMEERLPKLEEFKNNKDMPNYAIIVHAIKSDCKYLGIMDLADQNYEHELKSKDNDIEFVENNYDNLISNINKYLDICKKYLDK